MKPIISPVPGAFVLLRADGVYTEAPLYVGPFDCGFVRNPRGDGYLRLLHAGGTSGAGVDYSGVWGAVLAKGQGNYTVVTPVEEKPCQQADYPQADWSKEAEELRAHLTYITVNAELYVANPTGQVESLLAALSRIEDYTCAARVLCNHIIGSYQREPDMLTRLYNWLTAPFRAAKAARFAANKAEGYRYAKHLLATGAAGAEERIEDLMFARDDGYDVGAMQALYEHYTTY